MFSCRNLVIRNILIDQKEFREKEHNNEIVLGRLTLGSATYRDNPRSNGKA